RGEGHVKGRRAGGQPAAPPGPPPGGGAARPHGPLCWIKAAPPRRSRRDHRLSAHAAADKDPRFLIVAKRRCGGLSHRRNPFSKTTVRAAIVPSSVGARHPAEARVPATTGRRRQRPRRTGNLEHALPWAMTSTRAVSCA